MEWQKLQMMEWNNSNNDEEGSNDSNNDEKGSDVESWEWQTPQMVIVVIWSIMRMMIVMMKVGNEMDLMNVENDISEWIMNNEKSDRDEIVMIGIITRRMIIL